MSRARAVLFDLGFTLALDGRMNEEIDSLRVTTLTECLTDFGIDVDSSRLRKIYIRETSHATVRSEWTEKETTLEAIVRRVLTELRVFVDDIVLGKILSAIYDRELTSWRAYPDVAGALESLRRKGYKIGLVSNTRTDGLVRRVVEKLGLKERIDVVVTSAEVGTRKPGTQVFAKALKELGVKPSEAVMVGDTPETDIEGAKHLGIRTILITRDSQIGVVGVKADAIVTSLSDISDVLEKI